jgi:hypothetical protein
MAALHFLTSGLPKMVGGDTALQRRTAAVLLRHDLCGEETSGEQRLVVRESAAAADLPAVRVAALQTVWAVGKPGFLYPTQSMRQDQPAHSTNQSVAPGDSESDRWSPVAAN